MSTPRRLRAGSPVPLDLGLAVAAFAAAALAVPASPSIAAEASAQVQALASWWPDSATGGLIARPPGRAAPSTGSRMLSARGELAATMGGVGRPATFGGRVASSLLMGRPGGPVIELRTQALTTRGHGSAGASGVRSDARARLGEGGRKFWFGLALERDLGAASSPTLPSWAIGFAPRVRDVAFDIALEQSRQRVQVTSLSWPEPPPGDTLTPEPVLVSGERDVAAVSARVATRWQRGRWLLESVAGVRFHRFAAPTRWAQGSAALAVGSDLALYASCGSPAPRWQALEPAAEQRVSVGLRVSPGAFPASLGGRGRDGEESGWTLIRGRRDWSIIRIRAPGASSVEVIGDFTGWQPVPLRRLHGSVWEVGMALEPGVHQVNLRLDGGPWTPPPGLPTTPDGFDGAAGVLVVQ